jgi:hypothetical protein
VEVNLGLFVALQLLKAVIKGWPSCRLSQPLFLIVLLVGKKNGFENNYGRV